MPSSVNRSVFDLQMKLRKLRIRENHLITLKQSGHGVMGEYEVPCPQEIDAEIDSVSNEIRELNKADIIDSLKSKESHLTALLESEYYSSGDHEGDAVMSPSQIEQELTRLRSKRHYMQDAM